MERVLNEVMIERYPAYKDSGVEWLGEVPEHWEVTRLGTKFEERRTKVSDKDFKPLSVTKQGILPQLDSAAKTNDGDNRKLVRAGDFVINSRSDRKGSSGISDKDGSVSLINIVIEPKGINSAFCNYLLKSYAFVEEFYRMGHGIVADLWTTRYDEMKSVILALPSFEEQTAIADFLDRKIAQVDKAIAQKVKLIELLQERRQILIHQAVTRGLDADVPMRDSGVEWIGEMPAHWEMRKLKKVLKKEKGALKPGPFGSDLKGDDIIEKGYKIYNQRAVLDSDFNVSDECISERKFKELKNFEVKQNDILLTSRGTIGRCCIVPKQYEVGIIHPCIIRLRFDEKLVSVIFIRDYIENAVSFQISLRLNSNATTIDVIYGNTLQEAIIVVPPLTEQLIISKFIKQVFEKFDSIFSNEQKEIEKLKEYKTSLINTAVTGKIKIC